MYKLIILKKIKSSNRGYKCLIKCNFCNKTKWLPYYRTKLGEGIFCSCQCHSLSMKGINNINSGSIEKGEHSCKKTEFKKGQNIGEKHPYWKGDKIGCSGVHRWVERQKGKASNYKCEHCNKQAKYWANKKHDYKRNLDDYMALCASCHKIYDFKYNFNV